MEQTNVRTEFKNKREARELAIYQEYNSLIRQPGAMSTAVDALLMQKYGFYSRSTIWCIRKRVEKRLSNGNNGDQ